MSTCLSHRLVGPLKQALKLHKSDGSWRLNVIGTYSGSHICLARMGLPCSHLSSWLGLSCPTGGQTTGGTQATCSPHLRHLPSMVPLQGIPVITRKSFSNCKPWVFSGTFHPNSFCFSTMHIDETLNMIRQLPCTETARLPGCKVKAISRCSHPTPAKCNT